MARTYTYDPFGRLTKKTDGTYTADYYYHYGDKLTKVASNYLGEGTVTYTYGGDQKRRSRAVSGGDTIQYRYDQGWNVVNEENGSGTLETTYVHSPVRQIGTVLATSSGSTASSGAFAYPPNSSKMRRRRTIGSTRGLWDNSGDRLGRRSAGGGVNTTIPPSAASMPNIAWMYRGNLRVTTGTVPRVYIIRRSATTVPTATVGSHGILWVCTMDQTCILT